MKAGNENRVHREKEHKKERNKDARLNLVFAKKTSADLMQTGGRSDTHTAIIRETK